MVFLCSSIFIREPSSKRLLLQIALPKSPKSVSIFYGSMNGHISPARIMPLLPQDLDENERWEDERAMSKWFVACVYSSEMIPQALGFPMLFARIERMTEVSISSFGMSCSFVMCIWCVYIYIWVRVAHVYICVIPIYVYRYIYINIHTLSLGCSPSPWQWQMEVYVDPLLKISASWVAGALRAQK